jgi:hypothetical protein
VRTAVDGDGRPRLSSSVRPDVAMRRSRSIARSRSNVMGRPTLRVARKSASVSRFGSLTRSRARRPRRVVARIVMGGPITICRVPRGGTVRNWLRAGELTRERGWQRSANRNARSARTGQDRARGRTAGGTAGGGGTGPQRLARLRQAASGSPGRLPLPAVPAREDRHDDRSAPLAGRSTETSTRVAPSTSANRRVASNSARASSPACPREGSSYTVTTASFSIVQPIAWTIAWR